MAKKKDTATLGNSIAQCLWIPSKSPFICTKALHRSACEHTRCEIGDPSVVFHDLLTSTAGDSGQTGMHAPTRPTPSSSTGYSNHLGVHPGPSVWPHFIHQTPSRSILCLRPSPLPLGWLLASSLTNIPQPRHPSGLSASLPASQDVFRFDSLEPPSSG